jgi:hypothetical protein
MWAQKTAAGQVQQQAYYGLSSQQIGGNWLVLLILPYVLTTAIQVNEDNKQLHIGFLIQAALTQRTITSPEQ